MKWNEELSCIEYANGMRIFGITKEQCECEQKTGHTYILDKTTDNCSVKKYICKNCGYILFREESGCCICTKIDNSEYENIYNKFYDSYYIK